MGRLTEVSQPKPFTKSKIELANLAGASEMTSLTSSILRIEVLELLTKGIEGATLTLCNLIPN